MLMKLGANGEIVTDDKGLVKDEYYITMSSRLCGYEATDLFIFGEYLYFVSPCLENESGDEVWAKERVVFNRIKLDKTSKVEQIYSSGVKYDQLEYEFYQQNGVYLMVWEKGESYYAENGKDALIRVNTENKSTSVVANNVSSVVFSENANQVFYVKNNSDNSTYTLKQYNVAGNTSKEYNVFNKAVTLQFVANNKVYVTRAHDFGTTTDLLVSSINEEVGSGFEFVYAYDGANELKISRDGAVIATASNNVISLIRQDEDVITIKDDDATSIKIIGFTNGCVVYYDTKDDNSTIKMVSYYNHINGGDTAIQTLSTIKKVEEDYAYFDLDDSYMYFYQQQGSNYYLNRLKVNNNIGDAHEMIGVYNSDDVPEVEEEEETEDEE